MATLQSPLASTVGQNSQKAKKGKKEQDHHPSCCEEEADWEQRQAKKKENNKKLNNWPLRAHPVAEGDIPHDNLHNIVPIPPAAIPIDSGTGDMPGTNAVDGPAGPDIPGAPGGPSALNPLSPLPGPKAETKKTKSERIKSKGQKVVRKGRKIVLKKPVLAMAIGRPLAGGVADALVLIADGIPVKLDLAEVPVPLAV